VQSVNALVVGTTYRFKSKYVTMIMYKPRTKRPRSEQPQQAFSNAFKNDSMQITQSPGQQR
jgi:hypothetical protein